MKRSIFLKVFSGYLLIVLALSTLILFLSFRAIRTYYIDTLTNDLKNLGITLKLSATTLLEEDRFQELDALVKELGKDINTRITIIDPEGVVLADSEKDPKSMENHRARIEIMQVLKGKVGKSLRFSTTVKEEMLYVALPVEKDGEILGVLRVSLFLRDINNLLKNLKINILEITAVIIAISLLGALIFSRGLSKPIKELNSASRKLASGDFNARVFFKGRDELKELGDSFNHMADQMKTLFAELSRQKEELNVIISSLQEGLCALDGKGRISLSNDSFKNIARGEAVEGKFYWEVVREPEFGSLIKKVMGQRRNFTEEIELNDRIYLCSATFLDSRERVVVIFYDVTEMKSLEDIKRDFVVNVSHELRTPLTAIKGFVETLEGEMDEDNRRRYLAIIRRHTDRLINIVQDLILLSKLEEKDIEMEWEEVNLRDLAENILKIFEPRLKEKNLDLKIVTDDGLPSIKADPFKLEQMFVNLIDNALKYTEKGEITISLGCKESRIMIEIRDTGIGIPAQNLSRIFERFYVVNKSRSRELGGTGLGLSIVKHIVLLHNGEIDVESAPGKGTRFTVTLPVNTT